ncbi:MAG: succinate dehydrogenase, hydrophobic membrane anchor protein [Pseudomonadota bacterium]
MAYLTDRKRARGLGSARTGTEHHWQMMVSSMGVVLVVPIFVVTFGLAFGRGHDEVVAYFSKPFPAIATALALVIIILHLMREAHEAIEDYVHGTAGKLARVGVSAFAYVLIATGLFALVRLAL